MQSVSSRSILYIQILMQIYKKKGIIIRVKLILSYHAKYKANFF